MTTLEYLHLSKRLMIYLHGGPVEMYVYTMKWFKEHAMPFYNQPINYN